MVSGALVRYRGYTSKGLTTPQIAVLVAVCSLTFLLGAVFIGGLVLVLRPHVLAQLIDLLPSFLTHASTARIIGAACLGAWRFIASVRSCGCRPSAFRA